LKKDIINYIIVLWKLKNIKVKFSSYIKINFLFNKFNLLSYKSTSIDKGKENFLELFNRRFSL
jgi:hypothetical protein